MANIGKLAVQLTAKTSSFVKGMKDAQHRTRALGQSFKRVGIGAATMGAAMAGAAASGLAVMTKAGLDNVDAIAKVSGKLGIATDKLVGLQHAAELSGVGTKQLNVALQRMTRRVSEAARGTGTAVKALEELGLNASNLNRLKPDQQMAKIADAMKLVKTQSDRVRLAFALFDSEGVGLVNTLKDGSAGLIAMQKDAENLGLTFSGKAAAGVEAANDAVTRAKKLFEGLSNQLAVQLAPAIAAIANGFTEWGTAGEGAAKRVADGLDTTLEKIKLVAASLDLVKGVSLRIAGGVTNDVNKLREAEMINTGQSGLLFEIGKMTDKARDIERGVKRPTPQESTLSPRARREAGLSPVVPALSFERRREFNRKITVTDPEQTALLKKVLDRQIVAGTGPTLGPG